MQAVPAPEWIAVDWGTTHLRAYAMDAAGQVIARGHGLGMGALAAGEDRGDFEAALLGVIESWLGQAPISIVMCGMVGSRQGWHEAGYLPVPQALSGLADALAPVPTTDTRLMPFIVPGISQTDPYDVMRGEETQLAGYVGQAPGANNAVSGRVCLPGTHAKWARLEGGAVTHFSTAMTGELFDLLTEHSILAHSVSDDALDAEAFRDSVLAAYHDPACLTEALFSVRAEGLLAGEDGVRARGRVSGLLVGAELAGAKLEPGEPVTLIGAPKLCVAYTEALAALGLDAGVLDGEAMVLRGLADIHGQLVERRAVPA
jgi:2-dehydro-3-deoxygalactonokinase